MKGAISEVIRQVRLKITDLLRNHRFSLSYAKRFLEELITILDEFKVEVSAISSERSEIRIRVLRDNFTETVHLVRANEQKLIYTDRRFHRDLASIGDELKQYLKLL